MENLESADKKMESSKTLLIVMFLLMILVAVGGSFLYLNSSNNVAGVGLEKSVQGTSTQNSDTSDSNTMTDATTFTNDDNSMMMDENTTTIEVEGGNYYFKPNEITVKKGETVKIELNSVEGFHDFVIDEFNIKTDVTSGGESSTVTFTPDKTGSFEFYCSVGSHREMGMVGTLIVE